MEEEALAASVAGALEGQLPGEEALVEHKLQEEASEGHGHLCSLVQRLGRQAST